MGKTSTSKSKSKRRQISDSDDDSHSPSDSESDSSPRQHRRRHSSTKTRSRRRHSESSESDSEEEDRKRSKKKKNISEEEIAEYLAKKAQKKAMKVAKKMKAQNVHGYANDSNPFGDSNLNEKFVWRKKIERDVTQGAPLDMFSVKAEKKRQKERMAEIEKVKKRREERAIEKAQHEEEMALLARERARAEFQDWEKKEEEFHFDQSKVRSEIRLREGRIKPIDILSKHLDPSDVFVTDIEEPYMVFKGLTVKEMEELHEDIKMHLDLDRGTLAHIQYWELQVELVSMMLDLLSRPMRWGLSAEIGSKLPFSYAYFLFKHQLFRILAGPLSRDRFLELVHKIKKSVSNTKKKLKHVASATSMVDHKSSWSMAMNFPSWFYFAALLLPGNNLSDGYVCRVDEDSLQHLASCSAAAGSNIDDAINVIDSC